MKNKLREMRVLKRITQYVLALETGISQCKISLIENELVKPSENEKKKLTKALKCKIDEVFPERF